MRFGKRFFTAVFAAALVSASLSFPSVVAAREQLSSVNGGEAANDASRVVVYSFFFNLVTEPFAFPLIGFVNVVRGSHALPQIGFINLNTGNFSSVQAGFVNAAGGDFSGAQVGFVNTVIGGVTGAQVGFVNTAIGDTSGLQLGFVNSTLSFDGAQIGFVNTAARESRGFQLGFVNTSTRTLSGAQIGFINYVDSIENGIPVGLISIVRNGGYRAIEVSFSEFHNVTVGLKLGVERFYSTIFASYNSVDEFDIDYFFVGLGFGSIINITESFFFNPELNSITTVGNDNRHFLSFVPFFGYNINRNFSAVIGPSVTWMSASDNGYLQEPFFNIAYNSIDDNNSIVVGFRAAVRFRF